MSFAGMIVWRHASFPKRPQINHANTATLRESWISSMHADKHTHTVGVPATTQTCAFLQSHKSTPPPPPPPHDMTQSCVSLLNETLNKHHHMSANYLFLHHTPKGPTECFLFLTVHQNTHTHTPQVNTGREALQAQTMYSVHRGWQSIQTMDALQHTHTLPRERAREKHRKTHIRSIADMEREQSLICNH